MQQFHGTIGWERGLVSSQRRTTHGRSAAPISCVVALALALTGCARGATPEAPQHRESVRGAVIPGVAAADARDSLPSWNDERVKRAIFEFVGRVTTANSADFVPPEERIAAFDNDGTLWSEQPMYFQFVFAMDRVRALAPQHPEWKHEQPFKGILEGDLKALHESGERGLLEVLAATHAGMTSEEFEGITKRWLAEARHPRFGRPYTELVYQPMLEVLSYLRANGFRTYIVSGGGVEFMRGFAEAAYGVPPEQVIGSSIRLDYQMRNGQPALVRRADVDFVDDEAGKPVAIQKHLGRRPILAFGNSDGELQMLEWTTSGTGPRLGVLVHHTDGAREWSYDRGSSIGRLDVALSQAPRRGWIVVDMSRDWKTVYPFQASQASPQK